MDYLDDPRPSLGDVGFLETNPHTDTLSVLCPNGHLVLRVSPGATVEINAANLAGTCAKCRSEFSIVTEVNDRSATTVSVASLDTQSVKALLERPDVREQIVDIVRRAYEGGRLRFDR